MNASRGNLADIWILLGEKCISSQFPFLEAALGLELPSRLIEDIECQVKEFTVCSLGSGEPLMVLEQEMMVLILQKGRLNKERLKVEDG